MIAHPMKTLRQKWGRGEEGPSLEITRYFSTKGMRKKEGF